MIAIELQSHNYYSKRNFGVKTTTCKVSQRSISKNEGKQTDGVLTETLFLGSVPEQDSLGPPLSKVYV